MQKLLSEILNAFHQHNIYNISIYIGMYYILYTYCRFSDIFRGIKKGTPGSNGLTKNQHNSSH